MVQKGSGLQPLLDSFCDEFEIPIDNIIQLDRFQRRTQSIFTYKQGLKKKGQSAEYLNKVHPGFFDARVKGIGKDGTFAAYEESEETTASTVDPSSTSNLTPTATPSTTVGGTGGTCSAPSIITAPLEPISDNQTDGPSTLAEDANQANTLETTLHANSPLEAAAVR